MSAEYHGKKRRGYIRWSKQTKYGVTHYQAWTCLDGTITLTVRDEYGLTPEQAIAVTVGSERETRLEKLARSLYADYHDEWPDRAEEVYAERMKELGIEVIDE